MMQSKKAQVSPWGLIYGIFGLVFSIIIVRLMQPQFFWGLITIVVTTFACYFIGHKASGN